MNFSNPPLKPEKPGHSDAEETDAEGASTPEVIGKRKEAVDPTRYGDWELNGRCIDF